MVTASWFFFAALMFGLANARHPLGHIEVERVTLSDQSSTVGCPSRNVKLASWIKEKFDSVILLPDVSRVYFTLTCAHGK